MTACPDRRPSRQYDARSYQVTDIIVRCAGNIRKKVPLSRSAHCTSKKNSCLSHTNKYVYIIHVNHDLSILFPMKKPPVQGQFP